MKSPQILDAQAMRDAAFVYVSRFLATRMMVVRTLQRKIQRWKLKMMRAGEDENAVETTCEELATFIEPIADDMVRLGLVNDREYVLAQLRHQFPSGGSLQTVKAQCFSKGVNGDLIDEACEAFLDDMGEQKEKIDLYGALRRLYKKQLGPFARKQSNPDQKQKALRSLASAGFSFDVAQQALDLSYEEAQEIMQSMRILF